MVERVEVVRCDVSDCADADLGTVAVLARLQLVARRSGYEIHLLLCPAALRDLLDVTGIADALPVDSCLRVEVGREPEQGEHPGGVQEEADPGDLPA